MEEEQLIDHAFWFGIASKQPELLGDPAGAEHMVDRFVGQYLPAALRSSSKQDFDRVWFAFWNYLVAPKTRLTSNAVKLSPLSSNRLAATATEIFVRQK